MWCNNGAHKNKGSTRRDVPGVLPLFVDDWMMCQDQCFIETTLCSTTFFEGFGSSAGVS